MATKKDTITNKIVLEGEAKYKKQLAEINRSYKEHRSELKAVTAEMTSAEDGMLAMNQQGDVLEKVLADQTEALGLMENHLEKVEAAYGKNSRQAVELRTKINNARAEMAKTSNELRELRNRLDQAADGMQDAEKAASGLDDDLKDIGDGANAAADDVGDLADDLKELDNIGLGKIAGNVGGIAGAVGLVTGGLRLADETLDSWKHLAAYTGAAGDELEQLKADAEAVYLTGLGDDLGEVTQAVATMYQQTGLTGTSLQDCTKYAMSLADIFGMDVSESARTAAQLMETFGITGEEAYDLIVRGAQEGADKNGNLLDTINEYAPYFHDAGKEAEEMFAAIIAGAQNGVYDVDKIGDSWKEFMLRIAGDDEGAKKALEELGFLAKDMSDKIAEGGPAADLATQQIIDALARVQDPYEQNRLGVELFGTQWEDTAGVILPVFDDMERGLDDVKGSAQELVDINLDDFTAAWEGATRRIGASMAEHFTPHITQATAFLQGTIAMLDGAGPQGAIETSGKALARQYAQEVQALMDKYGLTQQGATVLHIQGVTIDSEGAKTDALVEWVKSMYGEAEAEADAQAGILGESMTQAETDAITDSLSDAQDAGEEFGEAVVLGYEEGAEGMYDAGENSAQSAVSGMRTGIDDAYHAGYATGKAFEKGYKEAQDQHSPSRVMARAAHFTTAGLLDTFEADQIRLQEAGAALGEAVRSGFGDPFDGGENAAQGGFEANNGGLTAEAIGQATARALVGMGVYFGTERVGEILEPTVSQSTTRRALGTIKGQSTAAKSW